MPPLAVAAAAPAYLKRDEVPSEEIDKEVAIYKDQMREQGKKEEMLEKTKEKPNGEEKTRKFDGVLFEKMRGEERTKRYREVDNLEIVVMS